MTFNGGWVTDKSSCWPLAVPLVLLFSSPLEGKQQLELYHVLEAG